MIAKGRITTNSVNGRGVESQRSVLKLNGRKNNIDYNMIVVHLFHNMSLAYIKSYIHDQYRF